MIKFLYIYLLLNTFLISQDSLYWFNFNSIGSKIHKTPKVLDNIFEGTQFLFLDSLANKVNVISDGYRLQIHNALTVDKVDIALKKYRKKLPDSLYVIFEAPFYKIHYGNYSLKKEAEIQKASLIREGFEKIWIVRSRINQ